MRSRTSIAAILLVASFSLLATADGTTTVGVVGPTPAILFLQLDTLNSAITTAGYPRITEVLFTMGGSGLAGRDDGVRFGGMGTSGATISRDGTRSVRLALDYYGLLVEKATHSESDLTVVLGAMLGGGSLDLRLIHRVPDTFDDAAGMPYVASMSKCLYAVEPYVAFETRPSSWLSTRLQFGLLWALTDPWTFEEAEFAGPPRTMAGLVASLTLQFGLPEVDTDEAPDDAAEPAQPDEETDLP